MHAWHDMSESDVTKKSRLAINFATIKVMVPSYPQLMATP